MARAGLVARLVAAQLLVLGVGALTFVAVAALVGPPLFHEHLSRVVAVSADVEHHTEEAFRSAGLLSLAVALPAGLLVALATGLFAARRITGPVHRVAEAARNLADRRYDVRVPRIGLGPDFDALANAFNTMASRLETTEATRRRLLADLAHELRTPLATVDAYVDGLLDGVIEPTAENLAVLKSQTARMQRLAEDVTAVSRAEEHRLDLRPAPIDPRELLEDAVAAVTQRFAEEGVRLVVEVDHDTRAVRADPQRIAQVLGNLLDNALRHTPSGGTVAVSAAPSDGGCVAVRVSDTGSGIPADHLEDVFERFHRVDSARDRAHGGSGIGLAIARAIVHDHGGRIWAAHREDGADGTVVTFTLPEAP